MPAGGADDELRTLFFAEPAPITTLAVINAVASPSSEAALLLEALRLQPDIGAANTRDMAMVAIQAEAPPDTQAVLLERALELLPTDVELKFAISNVRKQQFTALNSEPHSRSEAALRRAKSQWLTSLRELVELDEGRDSSTVHQNLATVQQLMGLYAESAASFVTALELLGLNVEEGQYNRTLGKSERTNAKIAMAALDLSRAHLGKPRESLHRLGVSLGFWSRPDQRPPTNRAGLFACPFYKREAYGPLVHIIEASANTMRWELLTLLRRRASDGEEAARWYADNEHIAVSPQQWLRRHLLCPPPPVTLPDAPKTCEAVARALGWYYGAASSTDDDAPIDTFYLRAQFSVLSPGAHILPHAGPTNERLAISLGLAGVGDASIRCGSTWTKWEENQAVVFDDSFEHEVKNGAAHPRAVLIVHFPHPQLMPQGTNGARIAEDMGGHCLSAVAPSEIT